MPLLSIMFLAIFKVVRREYANRSTADNNHFNRAYQHSAVTETFGGGTLPH
jgi:hypothetical protein